MSFFLILTLLILYENNKSLRTNQSMKDLIYNELMMLPLCIINERFSIESINDATSL